MKIYVDMHTYMNLYRGLRERGVIYNVGEGYRECP